MYQSQSDVYDGLRLHHCYCGLVCTLVTTSLFVLSGDCVFAQITEDNTLGSENSSVTNHLTNGQTIYQIDGGAIRGYNLFHSFEQFSLSNGSTAHFNNNINIQNIITRVTGNSISSIDGILKTNGTANLFLINPNGIVFGSHAALDIQGSFLASTASSVNFANNLQFSATNPQPVPLLVLDVPIGLQFGTKAAAIYNQSQASLGGATNRLRNPAGLQVQSQRTLALVGGDLTLAGGNLTAKQGRIELGSVSPNSFVSLQPTSQGWVLGYENVRDFQNVQIIPGTIGSSIKVSQVDVSGEGSGSIHVQGKQVLVKGGSQLLANTLGARQGDNLTIQASESVELVGGTPLTTVTFGSGNAGDLKITTGKLIVSNVAQVLAGAQFLNNTPSQNQNLRLGSGGKIIVNASESILLTGSNSLFPGGLFTATPDNGDAGDVIINTRVLRIENGARIGTESGGRIVSRRYIPATGKGGNITVNASDAVEIIGTSTSNFPSGFSTTTRGIGAAGNLVLNTGELIIRDGGAIAASSAVPTIPFTYVGDPTKLGSAGEIYINARSIRLENRGKLIAESEAGRGGNITLQVQDLLTMRRESQISTNAGRTLGQGDGGNITINTPNGFIVGALLENNDITANAFNGNGGQVTINTKNIFGFVPRTRAELVRLLQPKNPQDLNPNKLPTNDITAFSQQNPSLNGNVQINTPDVDASQGIVELPTNIVDTSQQITSACNPEKNTERPSFLATGRGGISLSPTDTLTDDTVLADWIKLPGNTENYTGKIQPSPQENLSSSSSGDRSEEIIEAQGWIVAPDGNVVLVAQSPITTPHSPAIKSAVCGVH